MAMNDTGSGRIPLRSSRKTRPEFMRLLKGSGWTLTALFFLTLFTLFKLPDDRNWPLTWTAKIQRALEASRGSATAATHTRLKFGFGLSYVLEEATVNLPFPRNAQYYFRSHDDSRLLFLALSHLEGRC